MSTNQNNQPSNGQQPASGACIGTPQMNACVAYEKAIDAYQFQVSRYHTWMNYYSIFVGAFFVALYSIWPKGEIEALCCVCKPECCKAAAESQEWILPLLISVLGWIASMCWYGALLGYRKWNVHWIKVVKKIETEFGKDVYPAVYTARPERPKKKKFCERIKNVFRCDKSKYYAPGFVSTQKVTGIFIFFVALAWDGVIAYILSQWCFSKFCWGLLGLGLGVITIIAICLLHCKGLGLYSSELSDKEDEKNKDKKA